MLAMPSIVLSYNHRKIIVPLSPPQIKMQKKRKHYRKSFVHDGGILGLGGISECLS